MLPLNLNLLRKNMVTDFFAILADVGALAEHALVGDDAHCKVVNGYAVVLAAHHLWRHVARRSRSVLGVFRVPDPGNAEIGDSEVTRIIEDEVFRLDVAMQNAVLVQILKAEQHARHEKL